MAWRRLAIYAILVPLWDFALRLFRIPELLGEDAIAHWMDEQIADYFGWRSPTLSDVIGIATQWTPPAIAALVCFSGWLVALHYRRRRDDKIEQRGKPAESTDNAAPPAHSQEHEPFFYFTVDLLNVRDLTSLRPGRIVNECPKPFQAVDSWFSPEAAQRNPEPRTEQNPYWWLRHLKVVMPLLHKGAFRTGKDIPIGHYWIEYHGIYDGQSCGFNELLRIREHNGELVQLIDVWKDGVGKVYTSPRPPELESVPPTLMPTLAATRIDLRSAAAELYGSIADTVLGRITADHCASEEEIWDAMGEMLLQRGEVWGRHPGAANHEKVSGAVKRYNAVGGGAKVLRDRTRAKKTTFTELQIARDELERVMQAVKAIADACS